MPVMVMHLSVIPQVEVEAEVLDMLQSTLLHLERLECPEHLELLEPLEPPQQQSARILTGPCGVTLTTSTTPSSSTRRRR